jgi:hypothetical protein
MLYADNFVIEHMVVFLDFFSKITPLRNKFPKVVSFSKYVKIAPYRPFSGWLCSSHTFIEQEASFFFSAFGSRQVCNLQNFRKICTETLPRIFSSEAWFTSYLVASLGKLASRGSLWAPSTPCAWP